MLSGLTNLLRCAMITIIQDRKRHSHREVRSQNLRFLYLNRCKKAELPVKFSVLLSLSQGDNKMSQVVEAGRSRKSPLVLEIGETAHLNYRMWRDATLFFRIRLKNGRLSRLVKVSDPSFQFHGEIAVDCPCCHEKVKASLFFY